VDSETTKILWALLGGLDALEIMQIALKCRVTKTQLKLNVDIFPLTIEGFSTTCSITKQCFGSQLTVPRSPMPSTLRIWEWQAPESKGKIYWGYMVKLNSPRRRFQINLVEMGSFNPMISGSPGFKEHSQAAFKHLVDRWQRHLNEKISDQRDLSKLLRRRMIHYTCRSITLVINFMKQSQVAEQFQALKEKTQQI